MMKDLRIMLAALFIFMGLIIGGCGEDVDPNMADLRLKMKATTTLGSLDPAGRVMEDHITFTEALFGVTKVEIESELEHHSDDNDHQGNDDDSDEDSGDDNHGDDSDDDGDDDSDDDYEIEIEGDFIVDLIAGTSDPDFGTIPTLPGTVKEIDIRLEPILEDGNSIYIEFTYKPDPESDPVTVQFSTKKEIEFEMEHHSGIHLDEGSLHQILVLFDLDKFLNSINFGEATADEDGIIRINSNSNAAISTAIWAQLHLMMEAGEDDDGDDEFDDD